VLEFVAKIVSESSFLGLLFSGEQINFFYNFCFLASKLAEMLIFYYSLGLKVFRCILLAEESLLSSLDDEVVWVLRENFYLGSFWLIFKVFF
jgi:hypothetical protein